MKRILVLTDFHVGSRYGLSLPEYLSDFEKEHGDSLTLYENYCEVIDWAGKVNYVFFLGDACDGWNPKEHAADRILEEQRQIEVAAKLLKMVKGSPTIFFCEGSGYHRGRGAGNLDEQAAQMTGAVKHPRYVRHAHSEINVAIEDVVFNLAHRITTSTTTWQYRTTPAARELTLAKLNENPARVILRGHAHYMVYAGFVTSLGMVCPGWQTKTPFMAAQSPLNEPRWGAVLFTVDGEDYDWDQKTWKPKIPVFRESEAEFYMRSQKLATSEFIQALKDYYLPLSTGAEKKTYLALLRLLERINKYEMNKRKREMEKT
jgi:predicted phosphodiesterase